MRTISIDADVSPVKGEGYRIARRYAMPVKVIANAPLRVPAEARIVLVVRPGTSEWGPGRSRGGRTATSSCGSGRIS
jgi:hypothetical protein